MSCSVGEKQLSQNGSDGGNRLRLSTARNDSLLFGLVVSRMLSTSGLLEISARGTIRNLDGLRAHWA